jgi:hypothetical protein
VQQISNAVRDRMYLVGDESRSTLSSARIAMFDAITYYWSTQDPYGNPQSFDQIKEMGDKVRAAGKKWYAPLNPGYNSILLNTGSCIPRKNGETLRTVWNGNLASNPDGWGMISWNEIAENTHIKPMQKWGSRYLDVLASLISSSPQPTPSTTGTFDDRDAGWNYTGNWTQLNTSGPYAGTFTYSSTAGNFATFAFTGSKITLYYLQYTNRGIANIYIDDFTTPVKVLNMNGPLIWQQSWTSEPLKSGAHTVKIVHVSGTYMDVDAIQVDGSSTSGAVATNNFDDKHTAFTYSSSAWQDQSTDEAYGGSYKETTKSGSFVTLPFNGQSFSIIYKGGVTYGKLHVYVDDILVDTLDQKLPTATHQKRWDYPGQLDAGTHILKLVFEPVSETINKGSLDAVIVR